MAATLDVDVLKSFLDPAAAPPVDDAMDTSCSPVEAREAKQLQRGRQGTADEQAQQTAQLYESVAGVGLDAPARAMPAAFYADDSDDEENL